MEASFSLLEASTSSLTPTQRNQALTVAISNDDIEKLRDLARAPGGFEGKDVGGKEWRKSIWPRLLGVRTVKARKGKERAIDGTAVTAVEAEIETPSPMGWEDLPPHSDERQVELDVNRSFIFYPSDVTQSARIRLRALLQTLIVSTLRKHPKLSYFQGYHDIVSVLLLTLVDWENEAGPDEDEMEVLRECVVRLSVGRIRDSMGKGLQPIMGYLSDQNRPRLGSPYFPDSFKPPFPTTTSLPLFSLSWILTLTAHDLQNLPLVRRLFDFLLAEDPIGVCYVGAGICLMKQEEVIGVIGMGDGFDSKEGKNEDWESEGEMVDEAMVHHIMAKLPAFHIEDLSSPTLTLHEKDTSSVEGDVSMPDEDLFSSGSFASPDTPRTPNRSRDLSLSSFELTPEAGSVLLDESFYDYSDVQTPAFAPTPPPTPPRVATPVPARKPQTTSIEVLIQSALGLKTRFPPDSSALGLHEIMGPRSCLFTWPQSLDGSLSDADAERLVECPMDEIVKPDLAAEAEERAMRQERERRLAEKVKRQERKMRKGDWEVTTGQVVLVAGVLGVVVAVWWNGDGLRSWVRGG